MPDLNIIDIDTLLTPGGSITDIPKITRKGKGKPLGERNQAILNYLLSEDGLAGKTYPVLNMPTAPVTVATLNRHVPEGKRVMATTRNVQGHKITYFYLVDAPASEPSVVTVDDDTVKVAPRKGSRSAS